MYKKIEKNKDNTVGFQKLINFAGSTTISGNKLLFTYASLDDDTRPYGNLFRSFNLPITDTENSDFLINFENTAFSYFLDIRSVIVCQIPKGEYGELIDGKTIALKIPVSLNSVVTTTTLYSTYFNFSSDLNKNLSDKNNFSKQFGYEPSEENNNNSNISYLFSNNIRKPVGSPILTVIYNNQVGLTVTGLTTLSGTVNSNDIIYISTSGGTDSRDGETKVTFGLDSLQGVELEVNKFITIDTYLGGPFNITVNKKRVSIPSPTIPIVIYKITFQTTGNWDQYTSTNKFKNNPTDYTQKKYAVFSGIETSLGPIPIYDQPVGIAYLDKGFAVITDTTLVEGFIYSSATSSGFNNISSGSPYNGDINFTKVYFSSSTQSTCSFNSVTTEFSQNILCIGMQNEFFGTTNATYEDAYDENTTNKPVFINSVGLYNKFGELIGIAKISEPIQKTEYNIIPMNIKLKI